MDLQSTFDYLMQIRKKEYAIKRKQLRCEELRSCLGARAIQYDRDRVQTSPVDKVSEIICKVADLEDQIEQLQEEKALLIIEIGDAIEQLEDDNEKTVLAEFYIGRVPDGCMITFADGNSLNCDIENLILETRAQHAIKNSKYNRFPKSYDRESAETLNRLADLKMATTKAKKRRSKT